MAIVYPIHTLHLGQSEQYYTQFHQNYNIQSVVFFKLLNIVRSTSYSRVPEVDVVVIWSTHDVMAEITNWESRSFLYFTVYLAQHIHAIWHRYHVIRYHNFKFRIFN